MKKILNFLKVHYLLFSVVVLYIIIPLTLVTIFHFSAHSLEFVSENIIAVLSGILAYIGTTVLGIVSVWQNKQAFIVNTRLMHLQRSEFEKNKSSIIRLTNKIEFSIYEFEADFFEKTLELPQNFYLLAEDEYSKRLNKVECVDLYFDSIGHELSKIKIKSVNIESAKLKTKIYKQLNEKTKTGFCYDFEKQAYKLSLLLFSDKIFLENIANKTRISFDIVMTLYSKADIQSDLHITIVLKDFEKNKQIDSVMYYYYNDEIVSQEC